MVIPRVGCSPKDSAAAVDSLEGFSASSARWARNLIGRSPARNEVISNPCHRHDFPPSSLRTQAMPLTPVRFLCLLPERQLM